MEIYFLIGLLIFFLIGSIPFGAIISRAIAGIDITQKGSGNIGATNVARELGLKWGILTLLLDLLKGFLPTGICCILFNYSLETVIFWVSFPTLLGHQFSPFQRFRGGKGVATSLGIFIAISPVAAVISFIVFIAVVYFSRFVSLGSMIAALSMPFIMAVTGKSIILISAAVIIALMICLKHSGNIKRLLRGEERRWRDESSGEKIEKAV